MDGIERWDGERAKRRESSGGSGIERAMDNG